ncbi:hypothetical protein ACFY9Q_01625 [Streptomyces sp. NPDC012389]|uniref:hypothetical protein n=1 Tax=Streptomyces sp. NPDC012389 TaxID=3364830 RepID=UPI0036E932AE
MRTSIGRREVENMQGRESEKVLSEVIAEVRGRLEASHPAQNALRSAAEVIKHDEAEMALDDFSHIVKFYRVFITAAEYGKVHSAARGLDMVEILEETNILPFVNP